MPLHCVLPGILFLHTNNSWKIQVEYNAVLTSEIPNVTGDGRKKSWVRLITISSTEPRRINVPTASLLLNPSTIPSKPRRILLMLKATLVALIAWNCGNKPVNTLIRSFQQLSTVVYCKDLACHYMEKFYLPITTDITTHHHYIILPCLHLSPIQVENSILFVPFFHVPDYVWSLVSTPYCQPWII